MGVDRHGDSEEVKHPKQGREKGAAAGGGQQMREN